MKRILVLILTLMVAIAAVAAPPKRGPGPNAQRGPRGGGRMILPPEAIAEFLVLSDAQIDQIKALRDSLRSTVEPLREQKRTNREALEAAVAAGDAAKAGELAIANYKIGQQLKAAHDSYESSFAALLTPEQKSKWEIYQQIVKLRRPDGPPHGERP